MYMSPRHKEGLAHLLYGIRAGAGFAALTGEVGTGKTTLCHCLLQQLPENIDIALILNPKLNALELLENICDELGIDYIQERPTLKTFVDALNAHLLAAHAKNRRTVLMIDEAQNLSYEVLEQIRLLTNLETYKNKLLQIILIGQPELKDLLNRQDLRQLNQRITARYHLQPLSLQETKAYIGHRLTVCGGDPKLFTNFAVRRIYKLTGGIPRLINILCDRALLGAYAHGEKIIKKSIVNQAANEVLPPDTGRHNPARLTFILTLLICAIAGSGFYLYGNYWLTYMKQFKPSAPDSRRHQNRTAQQWALVQPPHTASSPLGTVSAAIEAGTDMNQPKADAAGFAHYISNPAYTLDAALLRALDTWGYKFPAHDHIDCQFTQKINLYCFYDRGLWKNIIALNRPTVLEFELPENEIRYGLLTGIRQGKAIFHFDSDINFPLDEVLSHWNGYFLTLWSPPISGMLKILPKQQSENVLWLRQQFEKLDKKPRQTKRPKYFDAQLKDRVIAFQKQHWLIEDGIVGPRTLIHLQNSSGEINFPTLNTTE